MTIKFFEVGGSVRDRLLGLDPKDFDYSVEAPSFQAMHDYIEETHDKIFLSKPEFLTIRALRGKEVFDYVMCRKEGAYSDGRHPDSVEPGTIFDDLARRDFTINAMAVDAKTRDLLDPHDGQKDLESGILRCVGDTHERLSEDPLRLIRAIRFCLTKAFVPSPEISAIFLDPGWSDKIATVSQDRVRDELMKCFKFDTHQAMKFLVEETSFELRDALFYSGNIWLKPTTEQK